MLSHCHKVFVWSYKIHCWNSCPIPQVIQMESWPWLFGIFKRFLEPWLDCPRSAGHHATPLDYERPIIGMSFHLRWFCPLRGFLFIEYPLCEFLCCWTNSHMQIMVLKECKSYVHLEVWKFIFLVKQTNFVRVWYQLRIYSEPYKSKDTFCNSMLSN